MKIFLLLFFLTSSKFLFGQETIDELHSWDPWYEKFYGEQKEKKLSKNSTYLYKVGISEEYYESEYLHLRAKYYETEKRSYIIDYYDKNYNQICKNGQGFSYTIETGWQDFPKRDSLVYQITDSIKTGIFRRYRRYLNSHYFLMEQGQLIDNKEEGMWESKDSILGIKTIENYKNGELEGQYYQWYRKENRIEEGFYLKNDRNGKWTISDTNRVLQKEVEYINGYYFGIYTSYWPNGTIKEQGNYIQIEGKRGITAIGLGGKRRTEFRKVNDMPVKNGTWKYYNKLGNLIKTENYKRGKLI